MTDPTTETLWRDFGERLRRFVVSRVESPEDADDIVQDVFFRIHSSADGLAGVRNIEAWIYRITRNAVVDHYRRRGDGVRVSEGEAADVADEMEANDTLDISDSLLSCLPPIIQRLPEKYREAIELTESEGLSQKELANRLGITVSGAKSRVQRARAMIRDTILECCHVEFDRRGNLLDVRRRGSSCRFCDPA